MAEIHPKLLEQIKKVAGKRPLAVINHILKHGQVTTEELKDLYGYNHPPRAARDVREQGIPLETVRVRGSDGRMIAGYVFGDPSKVEQNKLGGRKTFSKAFKALLLERQGAICAITGEPLHPRYLSIDHRIPYEVAGERVSGEDDPAAFMLISAAAQRQKSWSCEHCTNWRQIKDRSVCERCYWGAPENYDHIAMEDRRRVEVVWVGRGEIPEYDRLLKKAKQAAMPPGEFIKAVLKRLP